MIYRLHARCEYRGKNTFASVQDSDQILGKAMATALTAPELDLILHQTSVQSRADNGFTIKNDLPSGH
jgi:hypothetical protein